MNANLKAPNNTAPALNLGSFVSAPVNAVKNTANNVFNSAKNAFNNVAPADISEPINDTVNATLENTPMPFVSVPVIVSLGIFIILFIIVVMFRQQIATGLEMAWDKIKDFLGLSKPAVQPPPPQFVPEAQFFDQGAVEKVLPGKKEVFNISQNKYSYTDAEPLCKAFGAELATYDQVKQAWQSGADWCNYGWVKGQAAVFPTQESTFNNLQAGPEDQRMACGVPGVNGGYFDNPEIRFGVNCYGTKPSENEADARAIMAQNGDLTPQALAFDRKVLNYKSEMGQIPVNPFKPGTWSS
jgi:hypothetical protein